jgi:hypothetical protein
MISTCFNFVRSLHLSQGLYLCTYDRLLANAALIGWF